MASNSSPPQNTTDSVVSFQDVAMRPQDSSVAVAHALGISPTIISNPLAHMPPPAVQDLISGLSQNAEKAQDLAMAASGSENAKEICLLTVASVKRLDDDIRTVHDDLRTVHANAVSAAQDAQDSEGWMRWVRMDYEKDIRELKMTVRTIINVMWPMLDDAQKAEFTKNEADVKAMREDVDRSYMARVRPTGEGQGTGDVNHE